jgi:hypothetical protein
MSKRIAAGIAVAIVSGSMMSGSVPALAAVTNSSSSTQVQAHLNNPDKISARGAAVDLLLTVKCPRTSGVADVTVQVQQQNRNGLAGSYTMMPAFVTCTGGKETVDVYVQAVDHPYEVGPAAVTAQVVYNTPSSSGNELDLHSTITFVQ